jgi:hypothetical protein
VVPRVGPDVRFSSFLLPVGRVCFHVKILVWTVVFWEGEGHFSLANHHLWGTCGPPAVHPSVIQCLLNLISSELLNQV